jgi:general secretion pathway protein F
MATFTYNAYDSAGRLINGELKADTRELALESLHRQGSVVVDLIEGASTNGETSSVPFWSRRKVSPKALAAMIRELATLLSADLPLDEALRLVALQPSLPLNLRQLIDDVLDRVLGGSALSDAFAAHPNDIPVLHCRLIAAGEKSGSLSRVLTSLADQLERSAELRMKVQAALIYPAILFAAAIVTIALVVGVLIPAVAPLFDEVGAKPPPMLALLIAFRATVADAWPFLLAILVASTVGLIAAPRLSTYPHYRDRILLRLPIVGRLIAHRETANLAGTLSTMLASGVPLLEALGVARASLGNHQFSRAVADAETHLSGGGALSEALSTSEVFTPLAVRLTAVGERTGHLHQMLSRLANIEQNALQRELEGLVAILAPALTIIIGLIVGGIILSVMGAIIGLNDLAFQ